MKGYPQTIATKHDLMVALQADPVRTKDRIRLMIEGARGWYATGKLAKQEDGKTGEGLRVVNYKEDGEEWYQEEFGFLPGNEIERLGLTLKEAEAMI